jgi:hypothetical protein
MRSVGRRQTDDRECSFDFVRGAPVFLVAEEETFVF